MFILDPLLFCLFFIVFYPIVLLAIPEYRQEHKKEGLTVLIKDLTGKKFETNNHNLLYGPKSKFTQF